MKNGFDCFGFRFDPKRRDTVYLTVDRRGFIPGVGGDLVSWDLRSEADIDAQLEALSQQLKATAKKAKAELRRRAGEGDKRDA